MFSHPAAVVGYFITIIGWIWLAFGVGSEVGLGRSIVNLHSISLAGGVTQIGYLMILVGVIASGFDKVTTLLLHHPEVAAGAAEAEERERVMRSHERDNVSTATKNPNPEMREPIDPAVLQKKLDQLKLK